MSSNNPGRAPSASHGHTNSFGDPRSPGSGQAPGQPMPVPTRPMAVTGNGYGHNVPHPGGQNRPSPNLSRSPPGQKNTKHVPCKFFRNGACTAGESCPYSHSMDPLEPCKFFLAGNCKYGKKCALPHIVNGHITNGPSLGANVMRAGGYNGPMQNQAQPIPYSQPPQGQRAYFSSDLPAYRQDRLGDRNPAIEVGSPQGSQIGTSPRYGMSPYLTGASALDVNLPSSFNSQDASNVAKFGKAGTSAPGRYGWDALKPSQPTTSTTHHQAYGNLDSLAVGAFPGLGSSPPNNAAIEIEPRRKLHSELRSKPQGQGVMSSSLPVQGAVEDDDGEDSHGEEFLPSELTDLLTPREKFRRLSRSNEDNQGLSPRHSISSFGSPPDSSKVGSPSHASPSSRYNVLFGQIQARKEATEAAASHGHVGSPLRKSLNGKPKEGSTSPSFGPISPPKSKRPPTLSSLSQQLDDTHINDSDPGLTNASRGGPRACSGASTLSNTSSGVSGGSHARADRVASGSTIGRDRIEEEPFFNMEDEESVKEEDGNKETVAAPSTNGSASGNDAQTTKRFADVAATPKQANRPPFPPNPGHGPPHR